MQRVIILVTIPFCFASNGVVLSAEVMTFKFDLKLIISEINFPFIQD